MKSKESSATTRSYFCLLCHKVSFNTIIQCIHEHPLIEGRRSSTAVVYNFITFQDMDLNRKEQVIKQYKSDVYGE